MHIGQTGIGLGVLRVFCDCILKIFLCLKKRCAQGELRGEQISSAEIILMSQRVQILTRSESCSFCGGELYPHLLPDRLRYVSLKVQYSMQRTLVLFAPNVPVFRSIKQLDGYANLIILP